MSLSKHLSIFLTGVLFGIVAVQLILLGGFGLESDRAAQGLAHRSSLTTSIAPLLKIEDALSVSARLQAYSAIAELRNSDQLKREIRHAATSNPSPGRGFTLELLLSRLIEVDPPKAVVLLRELDLPNHWLSFVFRNWAEIDAHGALTGFGLLGPDPLIAHAVAMTLLEVFGNNQHTIDRLLAERPSLDALSLRLEGLASLTGLDMETALFSIASLPDRSSRRIVLEALATKGAWLHPDKALSLIHHLPDWEDRMFFARPAMERWAELDPQGFLTHLETLSADPWNVTRAELGLRAIAAADPDRLLAATDRFPSTWRTAARYVAIEALAQQRPAAAIDYVDSMPAGEGRNRMMHALALGYARADADAAIVWAHSARSSGADLADAILTAVAATDLDRAIDIAMSGNLPRGASPRPPAWLGPSLQNEFGRASELADRILSHASGSQLPPLLQSILSHWARVDAASALSWLTSRNAANFATIRPLASEMGVQDPYGSLAHAALLPDRLRNEWIEGAMGAYGARDPHGALDVMASLQGQPVYDSVVQRLVSAASIFDDTQTALQLFGRASPAAQRSIAPQLASNWAHREPAEAARWSVELTDLPMQAAALRAVIMTWARTDADAADLWIRSLPPSEARNQAFAYWELVAPDLSRSNGP